MSYVDEIEILRKEIDRIDGEIVEEIAEWVRASKELATKTHIRGLTDEHSVDVDGADRIFRVLSGLVEEGRVS